MCALYSFFSGLLAFFALVFFLFARRLLFCYVFVIELNMIDFYFGCCVRFGLGWAYDYNVLCGLNESRQITHKDQFLCRVFALVSAALYGCK